MNQTIKILFLLLLFSVSACNNNNDNNKGNNEEEFYQAMKHIEADMKESQKKTSEEWLKGYDTFTEYEVTPFQIPETKTDKQKKDIK